MRRVVLIALCVLALGGCSWFGDDKQKRLEGERIPILSLDEVPNPDPRIQDLRVRLPKPEPNDAWPQQGGMPNHAMQHLAAGGPL